MFTDAMRNRALAAAMEWGPTRGLTRAQRVAEAVDGVDEAAAQQLLAEVESVEWLGSAYVADHSAAGGKRVSAAEMAAAVRERYPWVDDANLSKIYNHACYDLWHG